MSCQETTLCPLWPRQSNSLCWHCCHAFEFVPVYLPSQSNSRPWHFYFSGNFCSWNCAKSYLFEKAINKRKENSVQLLSLLAFVSSHRPAHCPTPFRRHRYDCPCISKFQGIPMAKPKTILQAFGGTMNIKTYRESFMTIRHPDDITNVLQRESLLSSSFNSITQTPQLRSYTYCFSNIPRTIQREITESKPEQHNIPKPTVFKKSIKHKSLC